MSMRVNIKVAACVCMAIIALSSPVLSQDMQRAYTDAELAGVREWEKAWAGKKIDTTNVDQVAQFLPDALVGIIKNPDKWGAPPEGYYFTIKPYEFIPETPGFIAASQANAGKAQLAPDGTIANLGELAGRLFMDPGQDAMKIAWNFDMQNRGDTYHYRRHSPNINPKNKSERVSDQEYWEFYFINRTELDPKPAIAKNPRGYRRGMFLHMYLPPEFLNTRMYTMRYIDQKKGDDSYLWYSQFRRIRRVSTSQRTDAIDGSNLIYDDEYLWDGQLLRRDRESLTARHWQAVILDEAQAIKNPSSQVAQAAYQLRADQRITLTGTPVENRLEELWSQLHFLNPGLLGGRRDFEERYAGPIGDGDEAALEHLRMRLRPFVLRRKKSEVAPELPPRTEMVLHCVLSEEERAVYDAVLAATRNDVVQQLQGGGNVLAALEALLRLRQACCHPQLLPGQSLDVSAKLALLSDRLETAVAEGHKALVFSQWTSLLDLVEPRLREAGLGFTRLDGSTRDRGAVVREFSASDGPPIFLISLRAGGTGLNLTAADHVFLLDPWWNPAVEAQAADRAHRIGQERPVFIHRMVAENTVEERILALQDKKRELADAALSDAGAAGRITREDLLALLA